MKWLVNTANMAAKNQESEEALVTFAAIIKEQKSNHHYQLSQPHRLHPNWKWGEDFCGIPCITAEESTKQEDRNQEGSSKSTMRLYQQGWQLCPRRKEGDLEAKQEMQFIL
jgi:hypothetical protein